jgi:hypothetical protein
VPYLALVDSFIYSHLLALRYFSIVDCFNLHSKINTLQKVLSMTIAEFSISSAFLFIAEYPGDFKSSR